MQVINTFYLSRAACQRLHSNTNNQRAFQPSTSKELNFFLEHTLSIYINCDNATKLTKHDNKGKSTME
ncbi:hypothetical protein GOP47_0019830 [Adiantum capillus-veneris]|uniref:Uncharacterized protein n=1 Tax=Adiantum capillus-veneris TaxID=13818 RepID=A0A9D4UC23_ADICA|nr:hypothetical protein GOP47_0019830 [Adiantum capillus-veneris]